GREYPNYSDTMELLTYCLMPNHFHLLVYQTEIESMTRTMRSLMTTYSMYFNKKYGRVGPVFQSSYKAVLVETDAQLHHISRYIHLNPRDYENWKYFSLGYYLGSKQASWVKPGKILCLFSDTNHYRKFLE